MDGLERTLISLLVLTHPLRSHTSAIPGAVAIRNDDAFVQCHHQVLIARSKVSLVRNTTRNIQAKQSPCAMSVSRCDGLS